MNYLVRFCTLFLVQILSAQSTIYVYDSATHTPLADAAIWVLPASKVYYSQLDGSALLPLDLRASDTILISSLGYERRRYWASQLPSKVYLSQRSVALPTTTIRPLDPKVYIQRAFDSFYANHLPHSFGQKVFYREEFIVNDRYARFQEMDINLYQYPKKGDARPYYISGSYPKVEKFYRKDDSLLMSNIKSSLGKIIGKQINFNYLSSYSYVKGVNMLNYIFTQLLENKDIQYQYLGIENVKGHDAIHIQGKYYKDKVNYNNIDIYLEEMSYAVLHVAIRANDEHLTKQFLDFKTRTLLWLLGVKIEVKKYYSKLQFTKTKDGVWVVEDFLLMLPLTVRKKEKLDIYVHLGYRMSPNIQQNLVPLGYQVYQENQHLFDTQKKQERFAESLPYSIPIQPAQLDRLRRMTH